MSDLKSALPGAEGGDAVQLREAGLCGMVTLRGDLTDKKLREACSQVAGLSFPAQGGMETEGARGMGWMSPDELLILSPYEEADAVVTALNGALEGQHHLAVNVSDARAVFTLTGPHWRDVVARVSPMDLRGFEPGMLRRTRFAQVAAAIWISGAEEATIVCFRSVAQYMFDLLDGAARAGRL